jgi:hypothetical protein
MTTLSNNVFQLAWPLAASSYSLQASTNLSAWNTISNGIQTFGTNNIFTNNFSGQQQFFRLKQ